MPPEWLLNSNTLRDGANILSQDCLAPDWFPTTVPSTRKNPVVGVEVPRVSSPFRKCLQHSWMNRHRLLRRLSFAGTYHSTDDGARDAHRSLSKVDVSPFQPEQLALPQRRGGYDEHQCPLSQVQII